MDKGTSVRFKGRTHAFNIKNLYILGTSYNVLYSTFVNFQIVFHTFLDNQNV